MSTLSVAVPTAEPGKETVRSPFLVRPRWEGMDGIRNLVSVALPLIITNSVHAINHFVDRMFLSWYSKEGFEASLQAGALYWAVCVVFFQTVLYSGTLASQYVGAGEKRKVGPVVWQAVFFALLGGMLVYAIGPLAVPFTRWIGHEGELPAMEAAYFRTLTHGALPLLIQAAFTAFFAAQMRTWLIFFINAAACVVNFCIAVHVVFEPHWGFPTGLTGAAWANVAATCVAATLFGIFALANPNNEKEFGFRSGWRFNPELFAKLLRYGFPSGVHGFLDMFGFTSFLLVVGRFGADAQFASNMAMNLNMLVFIPAVGMHMGISVVAGQLCGGLNQRGAERMTTAAALLLGSYMLLICGYLVFFPDNLLQLFYSPMPAEDWTRLVHVSKTLLYFTAAYTTFDALTLVYSGTLKGAGDTRFVMLISMVLSITVLATPCLILGHYAKSFANPINGLYIAWAFCATYILVLAMANMWRYRSGHWKRIRMVHGT